MYQVSNRGRVRALERTDSAGQRRPLRIRQSKPRPNGRRYLPLCKKGVVRDCCVSVLAALAYRIPNPRRCRYVIHRNHDHADFRRGNLAWATLAELRLHDGRKWLCPYYGVTRNSRRRGVLGWMAFVRDGKKRFDFGLYATAEEAAYAYDREVKRLGLRRPLNGLPKPRTWQPVIKSLPGEIWKPFPGASRKYLISNKGRVRTLAHIASNGHRVTPKLRRISISPQGRPTIAIRPGGERQRRYMVDSVMEKAFGRPRQAA